MRRRPLMNSIVMTINLIIVFIICFIVFTLIGGFVSNKAFAFLAKNMSNTSSIYYYIYFGTKSIINYLIIFFSTIYGVKYTFKYFVCYKDDGEKVFKYSLVGLILLLVYNYYSMFNKMVSSLKTFDDEKIFVNTEALKNLWSNLQSNIKIIFLIVNFILAAAILIYSIKSKDKFIDKCDFRIGG